MLDDDLYRYAPDIEREIAVRGETLKSKMPPLKTKGDCVELLKSSASLWNEYRRQNKGVYLNLSQVNLAGADLCECNLTDVNLVDAILDCADLRGAFLNRADLTGASLCGAKLQGSGFIGAALGECDLHDANMRGAVFSYANMRRANLTRVKAFGALFTQCDLSFAIMMRADLECADFKQDRLYGTMFNRSDLTRANFWGADFGYGADVARLDGASIPWDDRSVISHLIDIEAGDDKMRRAFAGFVLISKNRYVFKLFSEDGKEIPEEFLLQRDWAVVRLASYMKRPDENLMIVKLLDKIVGVRSPHDLDLKDGVDKPLDS